MSGLQPSPAPAAVRTASITPRSSASALDDVRLTGSCGSMPATPQQALPTPGGWSRGWAVGHLGLESSDDNYSCCCLGPPVSSAAEGSCQPAASRRWDEQLLKLVVHSTEWTDDAAW